MFLEFRESVMVINVVNKKQFRGSGEYIGRPSILGNPFLIGRDGNREQVIAKYRTWLWGEIKKRDKVCAELVRLLKLSETQDIILVCHCKPLACHGDVIVNAIEWLGTQLRISPELTNRLKCRNATCGAVRCVDSPTCKLFTVACTKTEPCSHVFCPARRSCSYYQ